MLASVASAAPAKGRFETCPACRLNAMPELKRFIHEVVVKGGSHTSTSPSSRRDAVLIMLARTARSCQEEVSDALSVRQLHAWVQGKGFARAAGASAGGAATAVAAGGAAAGAAGAGGDQAPLPGAAAPRRAGSSAAGRAAAAAPAPADPLLALACEQKIEALGAGGGADISGLMFHLASSRGRRAAACVEVADGGVPGGAGGDCARGRPAPPPPPARDARRGLGGARAARAGAPVAPRSVQDGGNAYAARRGAARRTAAAAAGAPAGAAAPRGGLQAAPVAMASPARAPQPRPPASGGGGRDLLSRCRLHWRTATLDHFSIPKPAQRQRRPGTFKQRVFLCDEQHWAAAPNGARGPIWLYLGNEADVTLYLNHTGLMWENGPAFGALLVFAEHRRARAARGPPGPRGSRAPRLSDARCVCSLAGAGGGRAAQRRWLTTAPPTPRAHARALDYAELVHELRASVPGAAHSPVVAFGGSYGGMLAAWARLKYPHAFAGAVAASAPVWAFYGEDPPFEQRSFAARSDLRGRDDVLALRDYLASAWDYLAMGDYPYPSAYMTNGAGDLPPFPVRAACAAMAAAHPSDGLDLMRALGQAAGVLYNFTGTLDCLAPGLGPSPESDEDGALWDWQWCTELIMPAAKDGETDMFWDEPFDFTAAAEGCVSRWGVGPRSKAWPVTQWGGRDIGGAATLC
ncbi:hypothetical protein HT031_006904 [Scenedesmus sp. PABB004]|nr:hypothetical protein HT031_006904 [Scenedesmus sp. PABB004]